MRKATWGHHEYYSMILLRQTQIQLASATKIYAEFEEAYDVFTLFTTASMGKWRYVTFGLST